MAQTKESVLALLKETGVQFDVLDHEAGGAPANAAATKNLFLRDKKKRTYVVTTLPETNVNPKILSGRLGLGSGNIFPAPDEQLASSLCVASGCASPLALANTDSCGHTLLLLDRKLKDAGKFAVYPIVNSCSVVLDHAGLEAFLKAIGREAIWVDLEAEVKISPENPPDLKQYVDAVPPPPKGGDAAAPAPAPAAASSGGGATAAESAAAAAPAAAGGGGGGTAAAAAGGKHHKHHHHHKHHKVAPVSDAARHLQIADVEARANDIIRLVSTTLAGKPPAEAAAAAGGSAGEGAYLLERLRADVEVVLNGFKNAAFTAGYSAGKDELVAAATRRYA